MAAKRLQQKVFPQPAMIGQQARPSWMQISAQICDPAASEQIMAMATSRQMSEMAADQQESRSARQHFCGLIGLQCEVLGA